MADEDPKKKSFASKITNAFKPKSSAGRLQKKPPAAIASGSLKPEARKKSTGSSILKSTQSPTDGNEEWRIDEQTGERDHTGLLHGLAHHESFDSLDELSQRVQGTQPYRKPGEAMIASLSAELWVGIASKLNPVDAANLACSSKTLLKRLGMAPWAALDEPENHENKINFLIGVDRLLPDQLLCFPCAKYHLRAQNGEETLKASRVLNPILKCPNATNVAYAPSRARLTTGHHLPFPFVQLVMRANRFGPQYGISADTLSRRYKDRESDWMHQTRYYIHKGRLLLRVVSRTFAPSGLPVSGQRHLLYSREDYFPYFSVCEHWRDGELMNICKCALEHVEKSPESIAQQLKRGPAFQLSQRNPNYFVSQCGRCRPMRRCPQCPTEYLIELKLSEDRMDPANRFKMAIIVTRWSDLGDGRNPAEGPWAACNGNVGIDSFDTIGKRALSGIFESQSGVTIPGQMILNLNPKKERLGEKGHNWY